jgi:hypothetical protein
MMGAKGDMNVSRARPNPGWQVFHEGHCKVLKETGQDLNRGAESLLSWARAGPLVPAQTTRVSLDSVPWQFLIRQYLIQQKNIPTKITKLLLPCWFHLHILLSA